ncbi:MAG: YfhO family protein, partial [Chloroflexota bacterium]|nr:YfhO family protein [Chloroflexota bacterium]
MLLSWYGALLLIISWLIAYSLARGLGTRRSSARGAQQDVAALGALAVVTSAFFWRVLFTPGAWVPAGGGDLASFLYPTYHYAAESLHQGVIPLWNPHLYLGTPFLADNQTAVFYPVNLLFYFLIPELTYPAMEWLVIVHVFLSGAFMYFCLRYLEPGRPLHPLAALLGGVAYMLCDVYVTHLGNLNIIATTTWLPLIFVFYRRAIVERRAELAAVAGIFLAVAALVGHGQMLLLTVLGLGMYLLWSWAVGRREGWRALLAPALMFVLTLAVGLSLAALTLLPAYEMTGHTARAHMSYEEASRYSLPPPALIGLLVPDLYGRGPGGFWGPWDRVEVGYLGVLPLVLAVLTLFLRRDRTSGFFAFLVIGGLLLALGRYAPVHWLFYRLIPGFDRVRVPARALILFDFGVASLAALGLDALLHPLDERGRAVLRRVWRLSPWIGGATLLAVLLLSHRVLAQARSIAPGGYEPITTAATQGLVVFALLLAASLIWLWARAGARRAVPLRTLGLLAVILVAVDLVGLGMNVEVGDYDPLSGFDHPEALAYLHAGPNYFRVESGREVLGVWQPDFSLLHGLYDFGGLWNPLSLAAYDAFYWSVGRDSPLYDLAGVKYLITRKDRP